MTIEKVCSCESEFQDRVYGKKVRVFNMSGKPGVHIAKCTVCGNKINLLGELTNKSKK